MTGPMHPLARLGFQKPRPCPCGGKGVVVVTVGDSGAHRAGLACLECGDEVQP